MQDVIIIGAGVVGCSISYYLTKYDLKVTVLEKCNDVSCGTTKANSAIIHAGYDPKEGTHMARLNVLGSKLTKEVCQKLDVPYQQCGAFVLGFNEEDRKHIELLYQRGVNNGVEGLEIIDHKKALELEPNLSEEVTCALWAKSSAIVSPWELCLALAETSVKNGADFRLNQEVKAIRKENGVFTVTTQDAEYQSRYVINCAGLYADVINEMVNPKSFTINSVKGEYYLIDKSEGKRVSRTIFQCPNKDGKGVLVSPTVHGNLIVGPNAEKNEKEDLSTTSAGLAFVKKAAVRSVPSINFRENIRNFAGNRAKSEVDDFIFEESATENFFNCAAICSPGLSSALGMGYEVLEWLKGKEELKEKANVVDSRKQIRFKQLSMEEKNELIAKHPEYGRVICRCETVTEGEILAALHSVLPAVSIDGVKRRCNTGMGRCQGGFCGPKITEIIARELHISPLEVLQDLDGSNILKEQIKEDC